MIRAMIVEDEQLLRKGLVLTMPWEACGCHVVAEASNAQEAIDAACRIKPDIIVTDIRMPGMNGLEMIKKLKSECDCEFIVISGYGEFEYAKTAIELGVRGYLLKPVDDGEFIDTVKKAVEAVEEKNAVSEMKSSLERMNPELLPAIQANFKGKDKYIDSAAEYIKNNYGKNINAADIAAELHVSERYISGLFKEVTGFTFLEYLTLYRIRVACSLLSSGKYKVYEVAGAVGYKDPRYFSNLFRKLLGVTPADYISAD